MNDDKVLKTAITVILGLILIPIGIKAIINQTSTGFKVDVIDFEVGIEKESRVGTANYKSMGDAIDYAQCCTADEMPAGMWISA